LQTENPGSLAQLEDVRLKVAELSNKGAEDEERIWEAERRGRTLETAVARLEAEVEERRGTEEELRERAAVLEEQKQREVEKLEGDRTFKTRTLKSATI